MKAIIADDEYYARKALSTCISNSFRKAGFPDVEILECEDAEAVLNILGEKPVDIIFTDIKMHGMDGIELCEDVRKNYPGVYLIIISGYADFEYAQKAITNRVFRYLLKPVDEKDIDDVIRDFSASRISREAQYQNFPGRTTSSAAAEPPQENIPYVRKVDNLTKKLIRYYLFEKKTALLDELIKQYFRKLLEENDLIDQNAYLYFNEVLEIMQTALPAKDYPESLLMSHPPFTNRDFPSMNACILEFNRIMQNLAEIAENSTAQTKIANQIIAYVDEHYGEDLSLYEISENVFYIHPNYLSKILKMKTGMAFSKYVTSVRMEKARQMLCDSTLSVSVISGFVGYNSPSYFVQSFHRHFGITPNEYRKKNGIDIDLDDLE